MEIVQNVGGRVRDYIYVDRTEYTPAGNWRLFADKTAECYRSAGLHSHTISACLKTDNEHDLPRDHANAWSQYSPPIEQIAELPDGTKSLTFLMVFPVNFMGLDDVLVFAGAARPVSQTETHIVFDALRNPSVTLLPATSSVGR
ncbi:MULTISPECIES: hypothetical protein [Paraburkholderia]|uniref:Uncharacterized protein n=1 Tax=Paraburkholderia unamae TaxID=219649 RepID=A0ACC6RQ91_9BURK